MTHSADDSTQVAPDGVKHHGLLSLLVRLGLPVGILSLGGVAYSFLSVEIEKEKSPPVEEKAIRTRVTELRVEDYPVVIKTNGIVQPHNEVTLSAEVGGRITKINLVFEVGAYFGEGDVLVELDDSDYVTAVAVAEAQRLGAESARQLAKQNHERNLKLYDKQVISISEAEINQSFAVLSQAEAQLNTAAAQLEQAKRDLYRTKIRAPFDGRVRQKAVGLGQSVGLGTPLGVVFAVDFAEVRLPIPGTELKYLDLPELTSDSPVEVELRDAINEASETVWKGKIVRTEGALDENSLELFAIARVDDPFGRQSSHPPLRIGQPVVASIAGKMLNDVVAVPRLAVRELDQVYFVDREELTLSSKTIDPLWSDEEHLIVRDPSIADGQWLATTRIVYAPDGAKVEIIPDIELTAAAEKTTATTKNTSVTN